MADKGESFSEFLIRPNRQLRAQSDFKLANTSWMTPFDTYLLWLLITPIRFISPDDVFGAHFSNYHFDAREKSFMYEKRNEREAHPRTRKSFNLSTETRKRVIKLMIIILGRGSWIVRDERERGEAFIIRKDNSPSRSARRQLRSQRRKFACNKDEQHNLCMFLPSEMLFSGYVCYLDCFRC